tara:strand:+ start:8338 stop:11265 length:2928 start_codon:yes stop_codon:yes gene_type:complete
MKRINDLLKSVGDVNVNPANIQRVVLECMESVDGTDVDIVDPSNPFVFLLESSSVTAAAGMNKNEALMRKQYPTLAQNVEELYHHMSDADYANRFAVPSKTTMTLMLSVDEIKQRAIETENGIRKMSIPRDTEFTVEGMSFTLQYPIDIQVMPHGGIRVVYDTEKQSSLQTLESNSIDYSFVRVPTGDGMSNVRLLKFDVPVFQFKITPHYDQINKSSGFYKVYPFNDQFYFCKVYLATGENGEWEEIHTTHSEQIYDPTKPTASLKVLENSVAVKIPQIYFTKNIVDGGIRVDVYSTKGNVNVFLGRYEPRNFKAKWNDYSKEESPFNAPIRSFGTMVMYSDDTVSGGRQALTFEELRERVINNSLGTNDLPITSNQLVTYVNDLGYDIVKDVDNITNRIYLATKELPKPNDGFVQSGMGCSIKKLQASIDQLVNVRGVRDNGPRITLDAGMVFNTNRGIVSVVENGMLDAIEGASPENRVAMIQNENLVYTPFHYVLDTTENAFEARAYHFSSPEIRSKEFIAENETAMLEISTFRYGIDKTENGFKIVLTTRTGDGVKLLDDSQIHCQLSFVPPGEVDRATMNGVLTGKTEDDEYVFEFDIVSNYDVDSDDNLILNSFKMYDDGEKNIPIPLFAGIDITYIVSDYYIDGIESTEIDAVKGNYQLPADTKAVIQERFKVHFGTALNNLWRRTRSVASSIAYKTYQEDVPAVYEDTVYDRDPTTGVINIEYDDASGEVTYKVLHQAGDPVLDADDRPVLKHRKGDVKLDADGNPIPESNRQMLRQVDLLMFEGGFAFATDVNALNYALDSTLMLVDWIVDDIGKINARLLENTEMWYYPKTTMGSVKVNVEDGLSTSITSEQSFRVRMYMTKLGYDNLELRDDLSRTATETIANAIQNRTISVNKIAATIKDSVSDDVLDVTVSGLGGDDNDYEMLTLVNGSDNLTIAKRLTVLPNNDITLQDDITVEFVRHTG